MSKVAEQWTQSLRKEGYEHTCKNKHEFKKIKKLSRIWKRILSKIDLTPGSSCFEVGCGGGIHLVRLALNGFLVKGIDCSPDVINRAKNFIRQVGKFDDRVSPIHIYVGDFLSEGYEFSISDKYDLVFDFGVVEHFLKKSERLEFIKRKFQLVKEGGWVVSVVPSGKHPYREMQRNEGLGGYHVPEINYTPELLKAEMLECGSKEVFVLPHNIMGYLNIHPKQNVVRKGTFYLSQILPQRLFKKNFLYKHAFSYIALGRK